MKRVKFNRAIYSDRAIEKTMMAYKKITLSTVTYKREYAVVTFWKCMYDESQTVKEFENYMIGVENS